MKTKKKFLSVQFYKKFGANIKHDTLYQQSATDRTHNKGQDIMKEVWPMSTYYVKTDISKCTS